MTPTKVGSCLWLAWLVCDDNTREGDLARQAWDAWKARNPAFVIDAQVCGRIMFMDL